MFGAESTFNSDRLKLSSIIAFEDYTTWINKLEFVYLASVPPLVLMNIYIETLLQKHRKQFS